MDWDLDPLEVVWQEETRPVSEAPASGVTDRLWGNLGVSSLEEVDGLDVGVLEVERLVDGDEADVVIKGGSVPVLVELHVVDGPALVAGLQVPVVSPGNDPVEEGKLALTAVGGGDDLVPVDDGATADVTAETLERDLPRELVWSRRSNNELEPLELLVTFWCLLSSNDPALGQSQVGPELGLGQGHGQTAQQEEHLHSGVKDRNYCIQLAPSITFQSSLLYLISFFSYFYVNVVRTL